MLPEGFCWLETVEPRIVVSLRWVMEIAPCYLHRPCTVFPPVRRLSTESGCQSGRQARRSAIVFAVCTLHCTALHCRSVVHLFGVGTMSPHASASRICHVVWHLGALPHGAPFPFLVSYATCHNFVGAPIDGYRGNRGIVTVACARALAVAQSLLAAHGLGLVLYDGYRPAKAVLHFQRFAAAAEAAEATKAGDVEGDAGRAGTVPTAGSCVETGGLVAGCDGAAAGPPLVMRPLYFPRTDPKDFFRLGCVACDSWVCTVGMGHGHGVGQPWWR
jgi:hypothetical protein